MSALEIVSDSIVHCVAWFGPTTMGDFPTTRSVYLDERVEKRDAFSITLKPTEDYFSFYDCHEYHGFMPGVGSSHWFGEPFNHSPYYVPGGCVLTLDERKALFAPGGYYHAWPTLEGLVFSDESVVFSTVLRPVEVLNAGSEVIFLPLTG